MATVKDMSRRQQPMRVGTAEEGVLNQLPDNLCLKNTFIHVGSKPILRRHNSEPVIKVLEGRLEPSPAVASPVSLADNHGLIDSVSDVSIHDGFEFDGFADVPNTIETPRSLLSMESGEVGGQDLGSPGKQPTDATVWQPLVMYHPLLEETLAKRGENQQGFACTHVWRPTQWQPWTTFRPTQPLTGENICISMELGNFVEAIGCMVSGLAQQLESCMNIPVAVKIIFQDNREWSIFCRIHEEHVEKYQHTICSFAKEIIWYAAEASNVFVLLGCQTEPFKSKHHGFRANVAPMIPDLDMACKDLYAGGVCSREKKCRWKHPHPLFRHRLIFLVKNLTETAPMILSTAGPGTAGSFSSSGWYPSR